VRPRKDPRTIGQGAPQVFAFQSRAASHPAPQSRPQSQTQARLTNAKYPTTSFPFGIRLSSFFSAFVIRDWEFFRGHSSLSRDCVVKPLCVDALRLQQQIDALAAISEAPAPVVTRILFSAADLKGRAFVKQLCRETGLALREDAVGDLFAQWRGADDRLPPVATGSHIDAIPDAGRYDGVVGVLGALEALRALRQIGYQPRRSIELIVFTAEEPTRFGIGCLGSRLMAGALAPDKAAALLDDNGRSLEDWRKQAGFAEKDLSSARLAKGCYLGFVELHIEQGTELEQKNLAIGVVEKIAAPSTLRLQLAGTGGHAGAVLMPERHDALLAGAEIVLAVEQAALTTGSPDTVGTTGVFRVEPGAVNSVPCRARLEIDLRDTQLATRDAALERIERSVQAICARREIGYQIERVNADAPALCDPRLVEAVAEVCRELGLPMKRMISRAYHDTLFMAQLCPATMIFIPCRGGVSHRPDEYSSPEQIRDGVNVLAHTLAKLAA
jgi:ureidoglycolate amidohydrolase